MEKEIKWGFWIIMGLIMLSSMEEPEIFTVKTSGPSMEPLYHTGDYVDIQEVWNISELKIGDIVLYAPSNKEGLWLHKIEYINYDEDGIYFLIKGISNDCFDGIGCYQDKEKNTLTSLAFKVRGEQIKGKAL